MATLDQSDTNYTTELNWGTVSGNYYRSQGITAGIAGAVLQVDIRMNGTSETIKIGIFSDNAGEPDTLVSDWTEMSGVTGEWIEVTITGSPTYSINDKFHIVGYCTTTNKWRADNTESYAGGDSHFGSDGASWTLQTGYDLNFKTYMGDASSTDGNMFQVF